MSYLNNRLSEERIMGGEGAGMAPAELPQQELWLGSQIDPTQEEEYGHIIGEVGEPDK